VGYYRAGFNDIVGVDIKPQPRYPFDFIEMDALEHVKACGHLFDVIHASPPCQAYSLAAQQWRGSGKEYPDLIADTRRLLLSLDKPYIIENVPGSPLIDPFVLNGALFGMNLRRTRWFETSFKIPFFLIPKEGPSHTKMGRPPRASDPMVPVGHFSGVDRLHTRNGLETTLCDYWNRHDRLPLHDAGRYAASVLARAASASNGEVVVVTLVAALDG
jgi:DNA (cytosine-5)-methyltransferase 1